MESSKSYSLSEDIMQWRDLVEIEENDWLVFLRRGRQGMLKLKFEPAIKVGF
jgi:hypothetical protein